MTKKLLALLLAALTVFTLSACSDKNGEGGDNLEDYKEQEVVYTSANIPVTCTNGKAGVATVHFESIDSDTVTITKYEGPDDLHSVTIPSRVQTGGDAATTGKDVAAISAQAFYSISSLISVTVPEGVTSIGEYAFAMCVQMESISLPSTLKTVGEGAFMGSALKKLPLPETCELTEISDSAFADCTALTEVILPDYIKTVGMGAFSGCYGVTTVVIPESVTTVKKQAFQNTLALASLTLPASFTNTDPLEDLVFSGSKVLYIENITYPEGSAAESYVAKMNLAEKPAETE